MKKQLFIPVETYTRSFNSRLRIAFHFTKLGGTSIIGNQNLLKKIIQGNIGTINILSKGEPQTTHAFDLLEKLRTEDSNLFLLDEEGGIVDQKGEVLKFRYDGELMNYFTKIYLWGKNSTKYIDKTKNDFEVIGNPRFDKLSIFFSYINPKYEISSFLSRYKHNVLVNTSFGSGNNVKSIEELLEFTGKLKGKYFDRENYEMHITHQRLIFLYLKKLARLIANEFRNIGIIIRPHPSENPDGYLDLVNQFPNVYIDQHRKYNAATLSNLCDLTIHHDCTTGIEALISGAKVIAFVPFQTEYSQPLPIKSTKNIHEYKDVLSIIGKIINDTCDENFFVSNNTQDIKENIINFNQDQDTALRIAEDIFENATCNKLFPEPDIQFWKNKLDETEEHQITILENLKSSVKKIIKKEKKDNGAIYRRNKTGSIDLDEVQAIVDKLNHYYKENIRVRELGDEVFLLEKQVGPI